MRDIIYVVSRNDNNDMLIHVKLVFWRRAANDMNEGPVLVTLSGCIKGIKISTTLGAIWYRIFSP